jgi:polygalacturonase
MRRKRAIDRAAWVESLESRLLLASIPLPMIPTGAGHLFVVTDAPYNAVGDGVTDDTTAIQDAINDCSSAGGGTVEIPFVSGAANVYEFSTLTLASNLNFQIDPGVELEALPMSEQASGVKEYIYGHSISNFEVTGGGDIDGDGESGWWGTSSPPELFQLNNVDTVLIQDVMLTNSPLEHLAFGHVNALGNNDVTINDVTIDTPASAPNTDGIDPAGTNFLIENCTISDGDDDIAVKPQDQYCANITIENCVIGSGLGISVGGETNDGMNGMVVNNVSLNGTTWGLRLKAGRGNGGLVENISYSNITMTNVEYPIFVFSYYEDGSDELPTNPSTDPGEPVNATTPFWENVTYSNITSTDSNKDSVAGVIYGLPEAPAMDLSFNNVNITAYSGFEIDHARNVTFSPSSHITVESGGLDLISSTTSESEFPNPYDATVLLAGFVNQDIGSPTVPTGTSSVLYDPDATTWELEGDGAGLGGSSDQFNYSYEAVTGNGMMSVGTDLASGSMDSSAAAGLMYRDSADANAPFVAVVQAPPLGDGTTEVILESRSTPGGPVTVDAEKTPNGSNANYIRLVRSGDTFTAYYCSLGISWITLGSVTIAGMPTVVDAGLFDTAGVNGDLNATDYMAFSSTFTPATTPPPEVANVVVDGTAWSSTFLGYLSTLNSANVNGYSIPVGSSAQAAPLPWTNLNQISIAFTQNVTVSESSLQLVGVNVASYAFSNFSYNMTTDTATWTLSSPIGDDALLIDLSGSVANGSGVGLDGAWTNGTSAYPSGNDAPGTPFLFDFNVLPGDVNQSGAVNIIDAVVTLNAAGTSTTTAGYTIFMDVTGSGAINILDAVQVLNLAGTSLPSETPVAPAVVANVLGDTESPTEELLGIKDRAKHHH